MSSDKSSLWAHEIPNLMSIRPMECWLARLNASSATMSHALLQTKAAPVGVICQGASSAPHFLLARLQGVQLSTCFPNTQSFSCTPCIYPLCLLQEIIFEQEGNSHWNKLGFFGHIKLSSDKSSLWAHEIPHLMSTRPMECWLAMLNASSATMSHALQQTKAAPVGVICQGASSAPHFLLARLSKGYSFQLVSNYIVFLLYTLHLPSLSPADCFQEIIFVQEGNSRLNKLGFFRTYQVLT